MCGSVHIRLATAYEKTCADLYRALDMLMGELNTITVDKSLTVFENTKDRI
jgi:hypothetical protein